MSRLEAEGVSRGYRRLLKLKNVKADLTQVSKMMSFSRPWNESTLATSISA